MYINNDDALHIYGQINAINKSVDTNEHKAQDLRKVFERILKLILNIQDNEKTPTLHDLINDYVYASERFDLQRICHKLRKDLNPWSHDNDNKLTDKVLEDYVYRLNNVVKQITGIEYSNVTDRYRTFTIDSLNLNDKQREAVLSEKRLTIVNAGPGTGKTYIIVGRILNTINQDNSKRIWGLSFTNKASDELSERIDSKMFGKDIFEFRKNIFTGTIHSFALRFIQKYFAFNNKEFDYTIIDEDEYQELKDEYKRDGSALMEYMHTNKLLTFERIMTMFLNTLKNNENFKSFLRDNIDEIVIDEAQDLDQLQYEILHELYQLDNSIKLFFVGDQRQNIYDFKGGTFAHYDDYFKDEDYNEINLKYSYRCPLEILLFVNSMQFDDCKNYPLHPPHAITNKSEPLMLHEFYDKEAEAIWLAKRIKILKQQNVRLNKIAVLGNSTFYFKEILYAMNEEGISFKVFGGKYFLNPHLKYLRFVLAAIHSNNMHALNKVQNLWIKKPILGKNSEEILNALFQINVNRLSKRQIKDYTNLAQILNFIHKHQEKKSDLIDALADYIELTQSLSLLSEEAIGDLETLHSIVQDNVFLDDYEQFKLAFSPTNDHFGQFYKRSDEIVKCENDYENEFITVSTIHSAKGLEWEHVFIPGMSDGTFPRYIDPDLKKDVRKREMNNELKKFYVACTRSKGSLTLSRPKEVEIFSKKNNQYYTFTKEASPFVDNLPKVWGEL